MISDLTQLKMSSIEDSILKSNLTCIGYTPGKSESMVDLFLSKFKPYKISNITLPLSILPYMRDIKLESILDGSNKFNPFILFDIHDIDTPPDAISRSRVIKRMCLRSDSFKFGYKSVVISSLYRTTESDP